MTTIVMSKVLGYEAPFEYLGIGNDMFVSLADLEGRKILFIDAKEFENDKGPGVYIAFKDGETLGYTTTHSKTLSDVFLGDDVQKVFASEGEIEGTIKQRVSKKSGHTYYMVE